MSKLAAVAATDVLACWRVPALAPGCAELSLDKGDTTWMLVSTILVIAMTIPGLALFYGGLVRAKNMLSVLMQVLAGFCMIALLWVIYGYSLAFNGPTEGGLSAFIGDFSKLFLGRRHAERHDRDLLDGRRTSPNSASSCSS